MQNLHKKNKVISSKGGWLAATKIAESTRKTAGSPTSCHLYNYCSNNPLLYIDPDRKAPYSVKIYENHYEFEYVISLRSAVIDFYGFIPYVGGLLGNVMDLSTAKILGFQPIIIDDFQAADTSSLIIDIFSNFLNNNLESNILSTISNVCTIFNIYSDLTEKHLLSLESFIDLTFNDELCAKSHEGVTELYKYVLTKVINLENSGRLSIGEESLLNVLERSYYPEDIEEIKKELRLYRKLMDQEPY